MVCKNDLLQIINQVVYNNSYNNIEDKIYIDNNEELLIITDCLYIRFSYINKELSLDEIILADKMKKQKKCFNLIGKLINYSQSSPCIEMFKVSSIVSNKMIRICEYYKMNHFDDAHYGEISKDYDFDGYLGNMKLSTK